PAGGPLTRSEPTCGKSAATWTPDVATAELPCNVTMARTCAALADDAAGRPTAVTAAIDAAAVQSPATDASLLTRMCTHDLLATEQRRQTSPGGQCRLVRGPPCA